MADPQVYSVPFLTSQSRAGHPFFLGPSLQGKLSKNIWVDEQMRIRRRPGVIDIADVNFAGDIDSMFEYSYRSRASSETRHLVGASGRKQAIAGVDILTDRVPGQLILGSASTGQSRTRFHGTVGRASALGVVFDHRELVFVYLNAGMVFKTEAEVIVDNLDYAVPDGDLVVAGPAMDLFVTAGLVYRLIGQVTGTEVTFTANTHQSRHRRIWTTRRANGVGAPTTTNQQWQSGAITNFAQFGNLLFMTDDSFLFPIRAWSGGWTEAQFMPQAPRGKYLATHQGRLWIAGLERNGAEIVGSGVLNPYAYESTGLPDSPVRYFIEQDDRDSVTAIAQSFRGDLYVWKNRSMHRLAGLISIDQPPQYSTITRSLGCASHRTVAHVGNDILWMSEKGVHALSTTDKFGDVESAYLSFPLADVFEELNVGALEKAQAVYHPRLGLYILGVAMRDSSRPNLLLTYSTVSQRWMTWDIGAFNSIAIGPPMTGESDSVYVQRVDSNGSPRLSVLDFGRQEDQSHQIFDSLRVIGIPTVLSPGTLFVEDEIRYRTKHANRFQVYMSSAGDFTANVIYSWDGAREVTKVMGLNPQGDKSFGGGFKLGGNELGNGLRSKNDVAVSSVALVGRGHTMSVRIEDSNPGNLPYLHGDVEYEVGQKDYTSQTRGRE